MTDPILSGYLADLASALTLGVLNALTRTARQKFASAPQQQALARCYQAGSAALLPEDDLAHEVLRPLLQTFFERADVQKELSVLARGREVDQEVLVELFAEESEGQDLAGFDFAPRLADFVEAFLRAAAQEAELVEVIKIDQLRQANDSLLRLVTNVAAIRRAVEQSQASSGDVTVQGDLTVYGDLVTGWKSGSSPAPLADPCAGLQNKYLRALQREVVRLPLASLEDEGAKQHSAAVTLDRVYIDLNTQSQVELSEAEQEKAGLRNRDQRPLTAQQAAAQNERLVLLGDPGSGKSAFVNYLAYRLADVHLDAAAVLPEWPAPPLPRRVILRDLAADLAAAYDLAELVAWPADQQQRILRQALADHVAKHYHLTFTLTLSEAKSWAACLVDQPVLTIFDGLDEVSPEQLAVVRILIEAVSSHHSGPIIVTCRIRSYQGMSPLTGFVVERLAPFNADQINAFIEGWYTGQTHIGPVERPGRIADLKQAVRSDTLRELASNPLLLTTMALVHTADTVLPDERVKLYQRAVDVLMRRWQTHKYGQQSLLHQLDVDVTLLLRGLWQLAYEAHESTTAGQLADVNEDRATGLLARACFNGDKNKATQFLHYVDQQAGLLVGRGSSEAEPRQYTFAHRTFQEYLAGCYLALGGQTGLAQALVDKLVEGERWYLVGQLAVEHLIYNVGLDREVYELLRWLCPQTGPASEAQWRGVVWSGAIAAEIGPARLCADPHPDGGQRLFNRLLSRLETIVSQGMLTVAERGDAGDALAALAGDTRPGVGITPTAQAGLPDHQFCYVPPGPFWLGSRKGEDDLAIDDEYGHDQPFDIKYPYWMARYPVTQLQYQAFVQAAGHRLPYREADWAQPYNWDAGGPPPEKRNHPVVLVSWHDAMAYCAWLTEQWGEVLPESYVVRLPTEAEWEKAARGGLEIPEQPYVAEVGAIREIPAETVKMQANSAPQRRWPWGEWADHSPVSHANTGESQRGQTMAVGSFPEGVSPYGCLDMAGNIWEWTLSQFQDYPYQDDGRNNPEGEEIRTLRGGSWGDDQWFARVSSRDFDPPDLFVYDFSFRVVVAPVLP